MLIPTLLTCACLAPAEDLATLRKALDKATLPAARVELLDRIVALRTDANTLDVSVAVADALEDDSLSVRAHAANLLTPELDHETAVTALVGQADDLVRVRRKVVQAATSGDLDLPKLGDEDFAEKMERAVAEMERLKQQIEEFVPYRQAVVAGLLRHRDDRCVDGLGTILEEATSFGADTDVILDGLLGFGTAPALDLVLAAIERYDDALDERGKHRKKLARQRPNKQPDYWRGTKDAWKEREEQRLAGVLDKYDAATRELEAWGETFLERLHAFASANALEDPPAELLPERSWDRWRKEVRHLLAPSLND